MKKIELLIICLIVVTSLFAQKGKVSVALSFKEAGKLDKAVAAIEDAVDASNPKTESSISWPRTWEVRGEIYQAIFQSNNGNDKKLHPDPLSEAMNSYMKATELDIKKRFENSLKIKLQLLVSDLSKQAETAYTAKNYALSLASFERILTIENSSVFQAGSPNFVDTVIIFNAGMVASQAKEYDKAINYFKQTASLRYNGVRTYEHLVQSQLARHDTNAAIGSLQEGLKLYTEPNLITQLIDIYDKKKQFDDALKYLDIAIAKDPANSNFQLFKGTLFERMKNTGEAILAYERAIKLNPSSIDAYFNLGVVYYNLGVKQLDVARAIPGNQPDKYEQEKNKADEEFKKALPHLEKARELNGKDRTILESLKNVYYRLQILDKYEALVETLNN